MTTRLTIRSVDRSDPLDRRNWYERAHRERRNYLRSGVTIGTSGTIDTARRSMPRNDRRSLKKNAE